MKEVFVVNFRPKERWEAISLKKQAGRYSVSPAGSFQEDSSEAEVFVRRNAGRIIALFPFKETYFHEIRISKKIHQKSLFPILKASTEAALPVPLNGQFHFDLPLGSAKNEERRLQFITSLPENAFRTFYELEMIELQPAAFFEGFSRLFAFPDNRRCFLYYHADRYDLFIIGEGLKIQKIRIVCKGNTQQIQDSISGFLKDEEVGAFYSWCDADEEKLLSNFSFSSSESVKYQWAHLKNGGIPSEIQPYKDKIEWVCHAIAFFEGFVNPCFRISPSRFSFMRGGLADAWNRMLDIFIVLTGFVFLYACFQLKIQLGREDLLYENISKEFYSFFSPQTPLINPVQQISDLLQANDRGNQSFGGTPDSGIFLQSLAAFFQNKPESQSVSRISQEGDRVYIEGESQDREKFNQWLSPLNGMKFGKLKTRIVKTEWPAEQHYRLIFEFVKGE